MRKLLVAFLLLAFAPLAFAYNVQELTPERPYDPQTVTYDQDRQMVLLGSLNQFPIMYELTVERAVEFDLVLRQSTRNSAEPVPFSLIVVKQQGDGKGVTEVGRMNPKSEDWTQVKDEDFGMYFRQSEPFKVVVEPGIYNIEVSTPENDGKYMLLLGTQELSVSYFETLGNIRQVQKFFGRSIFSMLLVPQVYYPIGIVLLLFAMHRTWKYRKMITHVG